MTTEPKGPRRVEDFPDCPSEQDIQFVKNTWDQGWAEGYKAGRASRDGLRAALVRLRYVSSGVDTDIIDEALAEDEKNG